jgi:hypothetical protein
MEFTIWLSCYQNLFITPCYKCENLMERNLTGDLLPPIIRNVGTCYAFHIKCALLEIELPDLTHVTLMSEDEMQDDGVRLGSK